MEVDRSIRILIADDMKSARMALTKALNGLGFTNVIEACDGVEALHRLEADSEVRLIISDWQMPNLEGLELADKLQDDDRFKAIPFIMATSKGELDDLVQATLTGVWGYVVKPITSENLMTEIQGVFESDEPGVITFAPSKP